MLKFILGVGAVLLAIGGYLVYYYQFRKPSVPAILRSNALLMGDSLTTLDSTVSDIDAIVRSYLKEEESRYNDQSEVEVFNMADRTSHKARAGELYAQNEIRKESVFLGVLGEATETQPIHNVVRLDAECIYSADDYVKILQEITDSTGGLAKFDNVTIDFSETSQTTKVSFVFKDRKHTLTARNDGDWVDPEFIVQLLQLVTPTLGGGRQVYFFPTGDQTILWFLISQESASTFQAKTGIVLSPKPAVYR